MSGGHFGFQEYQMAALLEQVANDVKVRARFPVLCLELQAQAAVLVEIIRELDYDLCGDASIKDDAAFQREALRKLGSPLQNRAS